MKSLWIEKEPIDGTTFHIVLGYYVQDMRSEIDRLHARTPAEDLIMISDEQIAEFSGVDIWAKNENIWVYDSSVPTMVQYPNPDWPYPVDEGDE